jgi:hypothetical protein
LPANRKQGYLARLPACPLARLPAACPPDIGPPPPCSLSPACPLAIRPSDLPARQLARSPARPLARSPACQLARSPACLLARLPANRKQGYLPRWARGNPDSLGGRCCFGHRPLPPIACSSHPGASCICASRAAAYLAKQTAPEGKGSFGSHSPLVVRDGVGRRGLPRPQRTCSRRWLQAALLPPRRRFCLRLSEQRKTLRLAPLSGPTSGRSERRVLEMRCGLPRGGRIEREGHACRSLPTVGLSPLRTVAATSQESRGAKSQLFLWCSGRLPHLRIFEGTVRALDLA